MAFSIYTYAGTGSPQELAVPPYISRSHISVTVDGALIFGYPFINAQTIRVTAPPKSVIEVRRRTPLEAPLVDFKAPVRAFELNQATLQAIYLAQELADGGVVVGEPPPVSGTVLPPQAGNAGRVLGTDGENLAWVPQATGGGTGGSAMPTVRDAPFSATGNGTTPDQAAFVAASAAHPTLRVPPGTYRFSANTTISASLIPDVGALFTVDAGVTVTLQASLQATRRPLFIGEGTVAFAPGTVDQVCAEWFGLAPTATAAANTTALLKAWNAAYGVTVSVGRGAFPLNDTELKVFALAGTSQLNFGLMGVGTDGNGGGGGVSANTGTTFFGPSARLTFNNDTPGNSDAKGVISGIHVVGPNDNVDGVGGIRCLKLSNTIIENTQVTGSRSHGYELVDCYGMVVRNNTALLNRWHGILWNRRANQAVTRDNKLIANGKDYRGIYANLTFSGGTGLESLGHFCDNNDTSYSGAGAVLYRRNNPTPSATSITLTSIVVSGGVATATTASPHGRSTGDFISVFGAVSDTRLNTVFVPQITVTSATTFTWPVILQPNQTSTAANGTYTDATLVIGPAAHGAIYNDMRGARISHYGEDCIGLAAYLGANMLATEFGGGYNQGFNIAFGGNGVIHVDDCTAMRVAALSLSGANSSLQVSVGARKHNIDVTSSVTLENGATLSLPDIRLNDGQWSATAAPTSGVWARGDYIRNRNAGPGQPLGWFCSEAPATFLAVEMGSGSGGGTTLPSQSGNAGRVLGTNGAALSWVTFSSLLPLQAGNAGRVLGTDGTNPLWVTPAAGGGLPSQTGFSGRFLYTNGVTASWSLPNALSDFCVNMGTLSQGNINTPGTIQASQGTFTTLGIGAGGAVFNGPVNFSQAVSMGAAAGTALNITAPPSGTALRLATVGSGSGMTIDASSGGTGLFLLGTFRWDITPAIGSGIANTTALNQKPGGNTNGVWLPLTVGGVPGDILWWPRN